MRRRVKKIITLVVLAAVFCMTGCSAAEKEAQTALTNILEALKSGESRQIDKYYSFDRVTAYVDEKDGEEFREAVLSTLPEMSYKLNSAKKVSDTAVNVDVELTTVDFAEIVENYIDRVIETVSSDEYKSAVDSMTEEAYNVKMTKLMEECIADGADTKATRTITVTMIKGTSGAWTLGGNPDELLGALFADLSDAVDYLV